MKKTILLFAILFAAISCQKELEPTWGDTIKGDWMLVSFKDWTGAHHTSAEPCWGDDHMFWQGDYAIISQGDCIANPGKPKDIYFPWQFLDDGRLNMWGDTVQVRNWTDSTITLWRDWPDFLEIMYKKKK